MKILVVDDEEDVKTLFLQKFRREIRSGEFDFVFANSGEQALEILNHHEQEYVLILSDINMPGMTGFQLLGKIRTSRPAAPPSVLLITAYGDANTKIEAEKLGADGFLSKPLDFTLLKERLLNQ